MFKKPELQKTSKNFVAQGQCPNCGRLMNSLQRCKKCGTISCYLCRPTRCHVCDKQFESGDSFQV